MVKAGKRPGTAEYDLYTCMPRYTHVHVINFEVLRCQMDPGLLEEQVVSVFSRIGLHSH